MSTASPPSTNGEVLLSKGESLKMCLEHGRSLFEYHANQRLTGVRYFLVAYGLFATAYSSAVNSKEFTEGNLTVITAILGACMAFVSVVFYLLDYRNVVLINSAKQLVHEVEGLIQDHCSPTLKHIKTIHYSNKSAYIRYGNNPDGQWSITGVMPFTFLAFFLLGVMSVYYVFC